MCGKSLYQLNNEGTQIEWDKIKYNINERSKHFLLSVSFCVRQEKKGRHEKECQKIDRHLTIGFYCRYLWVYRRRRYRGLHNVMHNQMMADQHTYRIDFSIVSLFASDPIHTSL